MRREPLRTEETRHVTQKVAEIPPDRVRLGNSRELALRDVPSLDPQTLTGFSVIFTQ